MATTTYCPGTHVLLVGTKRGLFVLTSTDRKEWSVSTHALGGSHVYNAVLDPRLGNRIFAADNGSFFGSFLRYSDDFGNTWQEAERGIQFAEDSGEKLARIWLIQPGRDSEPQTIYAGVDPASLWVSRDAGVTWDLVPGLSNHPTRGRWNPGFGGLCLHSIVPDASNNRRMWVGISAVGVLRTDDGGETWKFANKNTRASFLPDSYPEFGQCVHRVVQHPTEPDILYQQNHCGVYKTLNAGDDWIDIQRDLPSEFGFPIVLDTHNPDTVFVIVEDAEGRYNFGDSFTVYRTSDAGETWEALHEGLPRGNGVKLGVLRHGMCSDQSDPCGIYVGTNTGQVFASTNRGDSWQMVADFLPPVFSVSAAVL